MSEDGRDIREGPKLAILPPLELKLVVEPERWEARTMRRMNIRPPINDSTRARKLMVRKR